MRKVKPKVRLVVLGAIILAVGAIAIGLAFRPDAEKDLKANGDALFEPIVGNPGFEGEPPPEVRRNFPDGEFRGADFYPRAKARIRSNRVNVRRLATLNTGSIARLSEGTVVEVVDRIDIALVKVVRTQLGERNPWHYGENQTAQYNGECGLSTTTNISLSC
ncbi:MULTISPECIES: hypothetical protein [Limnospira]|uniref:Uncharacterized protein n=4 Tax=Sirenicapillariaceae TaxID=2934961 RepID=B5VVG3_LIMMA|nr:hypothetical protein [Limnospira maxima]EDZ96581.1 hypothetical protein AmaxDRAFT_0504 [Limnospira maxima CS-328]UWU47897.1 hypothetical protein APLC1_2678 [Arthrospira platensis C1]